MAFPRPVKFSSDGQYLAESSPDGLVKIWETSTGTLKQEYTPSSHLSATCTCIAWCCRKQTIEPKKRKKHDRAENIERSVGELNLLGMGTASGTVLLYSFTNASLYSELVGGHSDKVNDLCWSVGTDSLFSCSNDHHVVEWCITSGKVKTKWKAGRREVYSMCLSQDGSAMLTASRKIMLWDLESKTVLKKFSGHATEVSRLCVVPSVLSAKRDYFISTALEDSIIYAWDLNDTRNDGNSLVSFNLSSEPVHLHLDQQHDKLTMVAITNAGRLHLFDHQLNGKTRKPMKPRLTLDVVLARNGVTGGNIKSAATKKPIPVIASHVLSEDSILIAYGNLKRVVFEKINVNVEAKEMCLERPDPSYNKIIVDESISKIKKPEVGRSVEVLTTAHLEVKQKASKVVAVQADDRSSDSFPSGSGLATRSKKRKAGLTDKQLPMEEKLESLTLKSLSSSKPGSHLVTANTMTHLLVQGLQSGDGKILDDILSKSDDDLIMNTIDRLQISYLIPLIKELKTRLQGRTLKNRSYSKWLECVLQKHTSYIIASPEAEALLAPLFHTLASKSALFSRLSKLQGRMNLLLSQVTSKSQQEVTDAIVVYNDDSSDSDEDIGDLFQSHSESEDNWDELTDNEAEGDDAVADSDKAEDMSENDAEPDPAAGDGDSEGIMD